MVLWSPGAFKTTAYLFVVILLPSFIYTVTVALSSHSRAGRLRPDKAPLETKSQRLRHSATPPGAVACAKRPDVMIRLKMVPCSRGQALTEDEILELVNKLTCSRPEDRRLHLDQVGRV